MTVVAGDLLIAHPEMQNEFFARSVVLLTEVLPTGVNGFVINKKTIADLRQTMIMRGDAEWPYQDFMFEGGPVNRTALVMIHTPEWTSSNTLLVNNSVSISSDRFMFEKMASGNQPLDRRFVFGQSIWSPGQLQNELSNPKTWLTTASTQNILFEYEGEDQWHKAIESCAKQAVENYF